MNLVTGKGQHLCQSADNQKICRGGRDIQVRILCGKGLLSEPTDEAFTQAITQELEQS